MGRWDDDEDPVALKEEIKQEEERYPRDRSRSPPRRRENDRRAPSHGQEYGQQRDRDRMWGKQTDEEEEIVDDTEPEPDFGLSGALAAETNTVNGVTLKYSEPPERETPMSKWRLYVLKGGKPLDEPLLIYKQTCYLFGRDRRVADIPIDHPSCSLQHAVLQYRLTEKKTDKDGAREPSVRPYLMDLGSTNGTFVNGDRLEAERYYELLPKDVITFGSSTREYVLLVER
jgi:smad nuclear-interacting protein 1